jgi:2-polyprenyl-3-methyl-5-hydroxy-6-metoxy-1,4-benzoquinol methylase
MKYNSVLKNSTEIDDAVKGLRSLGLFPHHDRLKSWEAYKMIDIINRADRSSFILDVGCHNCPILPMVRRLGFKNLYGCDLFPNKVYPALMKIICSFYKRDYKPIIEIYEGKEFNISVQDLEKTKFQSGMFDYITSLSVVEHGVNIQNYFTEMSRIIKKGGILLTSTDFWPHKIDTSGTTKANPKGTSDTVFSRDEIEQDVVKTAEQNGFVLTDPIDFAYQDKVLHWKGLNCTSIFFALKKI